MAASPSPIQEFRRVVGLIYKLALTLLIGCLLAALLSSYFHYRAVRNGIGEAERLVGQGRLAEGDALAYDLAFDPDRGWARCFPGYFRSFGLIRIRCLARSGQSQAALDIAEEMRLYEDTLVQRGSLDMALRQPLPWLQSLGASLVSSLSASLAPIERPGELAGYEVLFAELVAMRDVPTLLSIQANSALGEADPIRFPTSAQAQPAFHSAAPKPQAPQKEPEPTVEPTENPPVEASSEPAPDEPPPAEPPSSWGIVTNARAQAFNPQTGQPLRALKAGDVLVIEGTCTLANQSFLRGTLILNNRSVPDLAFRAEDLAIRQGAFNNVPPDVVALRSRLAEIAIEEEPLARLAADENANLSPQEKDYRLSAERMAQFQRDTQALVAKLDKAAGNERSAIIDKLRLMKYQEQALMRDLQKKKEIRDAVAPSAARPQNGNKLTALRQEKQAILKRLGAAAP